jgi:dipeptidyl aminopeptidase/acylaminoacyl peptidase
LSSLTKMRYSQSDWASYLASSQEIIVATTDGRGTDDRGRRFRWAIHHDLGNKEVDDQLTLARYLRGLPFVDPALIAIKGWSYGGYLAAKTMERNSDLLRIGISVAPVYSWKGYDSLYTERYMGFCDGIKGSESEIRYERSRVHASKKAFSSTSSSYLLIQGTGDDNGK